MSLWSSIKSWLKTAWNWVTWNDEDDDVYSTTVSNDETPDTGKQTLNEQIKSWNISVSNNVNNQSTVSNQADGFWYIKNYLDNQQSDVSPIENATEPEALQQIRTEVDDGDVSIWDIVYNKKAEEKKTETKPEKKGSVSEANSKYEALEKFDAIGYDEDSNNVLYLDLNEDRWFWDMDWGTRSWTEEMYNTYLSEFLLNSNRPWVTAEEQAKAWKDFYDNAKWLFRIRSDDYYTNWTLWSIKRRKDMYTEDELATLASNNKSKWRYEPTPEEFRDFVWMKMDNDQTRRDIYEMYWLTSDENDETQTFELNWDFWSKRMEWVRNIALENVDAMLEPMKTVNPNAAQEALLTYSSQVLWDQLGRYYQRVAPVYEYEREILWRDKSTWSEWDKELLATASKFREMDKAFAHWLNDWFRQTLLYWTDKNWEIVNSIDEFENWESLSDVLTKDMKKISWVDWALEWHQSALDVASKMANEATYQYMKDKVGWVRRAWNTVESWFDTAWHWLWEGWQAIFWTTMDVVNGFVTWRDSLTSDYLDQDFTIWRLIETDDSNVGRTIKKYLLEWAEYVPEVVGNLIPDVALAFATGPWALTTLSRHLVNIKRVYNVINEAKWASMLAKTWSILKSAIGATNYLKEAKNLWLSVDAVRKIAEWAKGWRQISQVMKTWAQLLDRTLTEFSLWQIMDSQWSAYDTEPYSKASFLWSVIPSVWFDVLPYVFRWVTWKWWFKALTWMDQWSIWSLARYIDSSDAAAENVARALWKTANDIDLEDLKLFAKNYSAIEEAAKKVYNEQLTAWERAAIWRMTKQLAYNYVNQAFGSNSITAKRIRAMLSNGSTNIADVYKYLGRIPGEVSVWPFVSTIKLKNWTRAIVTENAWNRRVAYSPVLDATYDWGFDSRVRNWFSEEDLDKLHGVEGYKSMKGNNKKYFNKVEKDGETKYYLNEEWLKRFWLKADSLTMESLWVSLADAERTREILKEKLKWADWNKLEWVNLTPETIDYIADTWAYDEIVSKVKEVLWC